MFLGQPGPPADAGCLPGICSPSRSWASPARRLIQGATTSSLDSAQPRLDLRALGAGAQLLPFARNRLPQLSVSGLLLKCSPLGRWKEGLPALRRVTHRRGGKLVAGELFLTSLPQPVGF